MSNLDTVFDRHPRAPRSPHMAEVLAYAEQTAADEGICDLTRLTCRRFLDDLDSGCWIFRAALPEFCVEIMTGLFAFSQGERLDGTPLRGSPLELMPWQLLCTFAICGFYHPETGIRRFTEAGVFAPRKTVKTTWAEALQFALALWHRRSGAKCKTVAGSLKQGMEGFDWLVYNLKKLCLVAENNPPDKLRLIDSSLGHSVEGEIWGGHIDLETLAFKPELFDSFNAAFVHLDELELYKDPRAYTRLRDASKGYTNKLILTTFTAGDDGVSFAAQHRDYMEKILRGVITGPDADRMFCFMAEAPRSPDGEVDFTSPAVHRAANPSYGVTIRPDDMLAAALQAEHNPTLRKEFLTRSLNVFVSSFKAWFDVEEFRRSDLRYDISPAEAAKLIKAAYGGADLSKLHDLTAAALVGEVSAKLLATEEWTPPEDVLCILPHCWFPITAAAEKADQDNIPLFGWQKDGWLDMPNEPSMDPTEPVKQFLAWKAAGWKIRKIGHDRKFARAYYTAMKKAGFSVVDQPQLYLQKSEGFRYIEHKAKIGCLCYFHAEPFEYCVSNVRAQEKVDDAVQYEKISPTSRIDVFDAAVFATIRMLIDTDKSAAAARWFGNPRKGLIESGIFTRRNKAAKQTRSVAIGLQPTSPGVICPAGYHAMIDAPEVAAAIWRIADMIGSMTIHLMQNTDKGDVRVRNALARKVDIDPFSLTTRQTWINWIVQQMLLEGNAFVLPTTSGGILTDLVPMPQAVAQLRPDGNPYEIVQNGTAFRPDEVLHFRLRPDVRKPWLGCSPRVQLSAVVDSIMAAQTTKTAMMSSEYKPPVIISVNADTNLADEELRTEFLEKFWKRSNPDEPVVLPADVMSVNSVKPLSLSDLAIKDGVELDRRSVGAIFGVPGFLLGVGSFNREEFNVFVSTVLRPLAQVIEQELTKKLLYASDLYFRFNSRSLYAYDLKDLADIGDAQYIRGLMTGNEVRDWIGLSPREGLDKLVMLENYIPADRIGDQAKLTGGDDNADET